MTFKIFKLILSHCYQCPNFKKGFWNVFSYHASGYCEAANILIPNNTAGIPKDCPLEDLP
jgi:hypothetical protein